MGELTYHILEHIKPQYKKDGINTEIEQSLEQSMTRSKILIIYTIGSILYVSEEKDRLCFSPNG